MLRPGDRVGVVLALPSTGFPLDGTMFSCPCPSLKLLNEKDLQRRERLLAQQTDLLKLVGNSESFLSDLDACLQERCFSPTSKLYW